MQLAGKIIKDGVVVGRIQMGDDGVAVVYVGATGTETLKDEGGAVRHVEILTGGAAVTVEVDAPIILTGKELGDFPDTYEGFGALQKAAEVEYEKNIAGKSVFNKSIPADVEFRKSATGKLTGKKNPRGKLKLIPAITKLIAGAVVTNRAEPTDKTLEPNIKEYITLKVPLTMDGQDILARLIVRQDERGHYVYDQSINKNAVKGSLSVSLDSTSGADGLNLNHGVDGILNTNQNQSQAIFDSTGGEYVLNLFLQVKDPVTGEWVEVPDEPIEFDEAGDGHELLSEQGLQDKATALGIVCEHIEAVGGDVLWATLSKNGVSANLNKNANGAWSLTKNPDGDILSDITNSTVDGNLAVMALQGQAPQVDPAVSNVDPQKTADLAYFQSVIDGKEDMLDPEFADKLEGAYIRHAGDAEIESLFNDALAAYEKNMLAEAAKLS